MKLGTWNAVRGCPGWYYGLMIRNADGTVTFNVSHCDDRRTITGLRASAYRTTRTARFMGVKDLKGWQHVAQEAIRAAS